MIKASDLIALFQQALDEHWGYIWGEAGGVWTKAEQDAAVREKTVEFGSRWIGRRVADCSGLFRWAASELGGYIYHGSNTMWNVYTDTARRGGVGGTMTIYPGTAVFQVEDGKRHHVGLYVGNGKVIEARGTKSGVIDSKLQDWAEWGELMVKIGKEMVKVEYDLPAETIEIAPRTLRQGDMGADVKAMQEDLLRAGYDLDAYGADGKFGGVTTSAVRAFQYDHGLKPDGIVGPLTLAALRAIEDDEPGKDEDDQQEQETRPLTLEERLARLEKAVFGQEGGDADG